MAKTVKPADEAVSRARSGLSDRIPRLGVGMLPDTRTIDSLKRCSEAVEVLFRVSGRPFTNVSQDKIKEHFSDDALQKLIMTYWYEYEYDHRIKDSDLKRELGQVVTHLRTLDKAMKKVTKQTRKTVNYIINKDKPFRSPVDDIFGQALRLNEILRINCEPLVREKFEKTAPIRINNLAAALVAIWEELSGEKFKYNTKIHEASPPRALTRDLSGFQGPGPHFLHVMLQAVDPGVTQSKVASSIKTLAAQSREKIDRKAKG